MAPMTHIEAQIIARIQDELMPTITRAAVRAAQHLDSGSALVDFSPGDATRYHALIARTPHGLVWVDLSEVPLRATYLHRYMRAKDFPLGNLHSVHVWHAFVSDLYQQLGD